VSVFIELYQFGMIIGCIYKPPNYVGDFVVALEKLLDTLEKQKQLCYLPGDFNIDILKSDVHAPTADFINCLFSHSFSL